MLTRRGSKPDHEGAQDGKEKKGEIRRSNRKEKNKNNNNKHNNKINHQLKKILNQQIRENRIKSLNQPLSKMANLNSTVAGKNNKTDIQDNHNTDYQTTSTPSDNSRDSYALCIDESNTTKYLHDDSTDSDSTSDSDNDSDKDSEKQGNGNDEAVQDMSVSDSDEQSGEPRAVYQATLPTTEDLVAVEAWTEKEVGNPLRRLNELLRKEGMQRHF